MTELTIAPGKITTAKKKDYTSYKPYAHRLLQQRHEGMQITADAVSLLDSLTAVSSQMIMEGGANLMRKFSPGRLTLQPRDLSTWVAMSYDAEFAEKVNSTAERAVQMFTENSEKALAEVPAAPVVDEQEDKEEEEEKADEQ